MIVKISFLLPVGSHARYRKRVSALQELGAQARILSFEREYYAGKPWPNGYISLGSVKHRNYLKRLLPLAKALPTVRAAAKDSDVLYAFGLDMLALGWLASRAIGSTAKLVYEVGDLGVLAADRPCSRILRWLERFLLSRTTVLVVTSKAYIDEYYQAVQKLEDLRYQVIENKVDPDLTALPQVTGHPQREEGSSPGVLRIGYFGLIRCHRSWETLKKFVERGNGRVQLYVRGLSLTLPSFDRDVVASPHIEYGGPYVVPDDLAAMYANVDIVWIAHFMNRNSMLRNRANRFYEACFFQKPMLAQEGSQDGRAVQDLNLGLCVDLADVEGTVARLLQIGEAEVAEWKQALAQLPSQIYTYTDEHERLLKSLQQG